MATPALGWGKHSFQRGPCSLWEPFSASLAGAFKSGERKGGVSGEGRACVRKCHSGFPYSPLPPHVSKALASGAWKEE